MLDKTWLIFWRSVSVSRLISSSKFSKGTSDSRFMLRLVMATSVSMYSGPSTSISGTCARSWPIGKVWDSLGFWSSFWSIIGTSSSSKPGVAGSSTSDLFRLTHSLVCRIPGTFIPVSQAGQWRVLTLLGGGGTASSGSPSLNKTSSSGVVGAYSSQRFP